MKLIKYKVKQFAEIIGGGTPSTKNTAYWEGDIPWITPNDLTSFEGVYIEKGERNITKEGLNQSSAKLLPKKTILLTSRAPVGYVAIAKNDLSTNQGFKNLICDKNLSDPEFVYYLLKINKKYLQSNSTGSTFGELSASRVKNLYFYLPEVNIQKRIASTLLKYDELIDKNHKRIQLLEEAARLLYREWFVYFRFPGHENVKIIDGIPEGWKKKSLSEIVTTQYGYTETATQDKIGPKFLRGKDINKSSYIDWNSVPFCSDKKLDFNKYYLSPGDILIIRMADPGKVGIVEKEIKAIFASYLVRLKIIDKNIPPYFLFYSLVSNRYQGYINGASTGSTRKSASAKLMVTYDLLIPKKEIINSFNEQMIQLRRSINILLEQNQKLAQARDLLLPRLMSGKIDVFDFDKDNIPVESEVEKIVN